jgi:hypothetical protein
MEMTVLEMNNLNVLAREGMCQMLAKNLPTESLQAGLDALKKLEKVIQTAQAELANKQKTIAPMVQQTQKANPPVEVVAASPVEVITQNPKGTYKKKGVQS